MSHYFTNGGFSSHHFRTVIQTNIISNVNIFRLIRENYSKTGCGAPNPLNSSRCAVYQACSDQPVRYQDVRRTDRAFTDWTGFNEMVSNIFFLRTKKLSEWV